jgi:branched-chain amino acid transport system substrate-binding protein
MKFLRLLGASALVGLFIILFETLVCAEDIKIGIILPLTGTLANQGETEKASFLMAAQGVNLAGGLQGNRIGLIIEDTAGKPEVGCTAFKKLISQHQVIAVTGGVSSAVSWAAAPLAQENQVPFLVSTASADRITEVGWDYVFRLAAPASEHHKALRSFLNEAVRPETAAILYENSYFGQLGS